ncbi:MAG: c-type cytochrome biogenesis protein CcmI [Proteobacteria bacterium]|nr:c-type cytochrome biogenesis protein CcmI [Pseudomonadota bacterium]
MTTFWAVAALMTVATLAMVIVPLLRKPKQSAPRRAEFDLTVYKDQLAEISRDAERGLLGDAEAKAASVEIKRRMLKTTETTDDDEGGNAGQPSLSRAVAVILAAATPIVAFGFYIVLGAPSQPDLPYAKRDISAEIQAREGRLQKAEVLQLTAKLVEALKKRPTDIKGWLLLGRTYLTINEFQGALEAFRRATEISNRRADIAASYAEAMILAENGKVTATARKLFTEILAGDPFDPKAHYYLGLEKAQAGNLRGALQAWTDLIQLSPADAPWLDSVHQQINSTAKELGIDPSTVLASARATVLSLTRGLGSPKSSSLPRMSMPPAASSPAPSSPGPSSSGPYSSAASSPAPSSPGPSSPPTSSSPKGPSAAEVKAAGQMSAGDRDQMIRSMVNRLADRLKQNPDDLAGWQRLAKAYEVLGDQDKAAAVRKKIEALTK